MSIRTILVDDEPLVGTAVRRALGAEHEVAVVPVEVPVPEKVEILIVDAPR